MFMSRTIFHIFRLTNFDVVRANENMYEISQLQQLLTKDLTQTNFYSQVHTITSFHAHYQGLDRNISAYKLVRQTVHVQAVSITNSECKPFRRLLSFSPPNKGTVIFMWRQSLQTLQLNLSEL